MQLKPILSTAEIEALVMAQFPKTDGERRCAFERNKVNQLRQWKRHQLQQQNQINAKINQQLAARAI